MRERRWRRLQLRGRQVLIGKGGVPARLALILDPSERGLDLSLGPFQDTSLLNRPIPRLSLLTIGGIGTLTGGVLSF
jgi:hypothetical protein